MSRFQRAAGDPGVASGEVGFKQLSGRGEFHEMNRAEDQFNVVPLRHPECDEPGCARPVTMLHHIHAGTAPEGPIRGTERYCEIHSEPHRDDPRFLSAAPWSREADPIMSQFETEAVWGDRS